jgi:hypothetical protein
MLLKVQKIFVVGFVESNFCPLYLPYRQKNKSASNLDCYLYGFKRGTL